MLPASPALGCCGSTEGAESSEKGANPSALQNPAGRGGFADPKVLGAWGREDKPGFITAPTDPLCAPAPETHVLDPNIPALGPGFVQARGKSLRHLCFAPTNPSSVGCRGTPTLRLAVPPPLFYSGV